MADEVQADGLIDLRCRLHRDKELASTTGIEGSACLYVSEALPSPAFLIPKWRGGEDVFRNHNGSNQGKPDIRPYAIYPDGSFLELLD